MRSGSIRLVTYASRMAAMPLDDVAIAVSIGHLSARGESPPARLLSSPAPVTQEALAGLVERVTFHNPDSGFCVLRAKARGHRDLVTIVGHAAVISAGEWVTASGAWVNDRTHGQQFRAKFLKTSA